MSIDNTREAAGYISRWMLLVVCMIIVIWSIWTAVLATSSIDQSLGSNIVVSDALWSDSVKNPYLTVLAAPSFPGGNISFAYCVDPLGKVASAYTSQYQGWLECSGQNLPAGVNNMLIRGIPYSSLGFFQQDAKIFLIPQHVEVYLLDARFAVQLQKTDKPLLDSIVGELNRLGLCAIVCVGAPMEYANIRRELISYHDLPMLCSTEKRKYDLMTTIWRTRRMLYRPSQRYPFVITSDPQLAELAAAQNHYVHLVAPEKNKSLEVSRLNIRLHDKFKDFAEYLAAEYTPYSERNR